LQIIQSIPYGVDGSAITTKLTGEIIDHQFV
jgi:hypothetical protein